MWVIGLTGGIGSGKSTVAHWLSEQGISVLDADRTVHELLGSDQDTIDEVVSEFGQGVLLKTGGIARKILGERVFSDSEARIRLEKILHSRVADSMRNQQFKLEAEGKKTCVWDVPLLFEAGFYDRVNEIWVVWVPSFLQKDRVMKRDALTLQEVELRIQAQYALEDKVGRAHVVIDNSGTWQETEVQLVKELVRIKRDCGL